MAVSYFGIPRAIPPKQDYYSVWRPPEETTASLPPNCLALDTMPIYFLILWALHYTLNPKHRGTEISDTVAPPHLLSLHNKALFSIPTNPFRLSLSLDTVYNEKCKICEREQQFWKDTGEAEPIHLVWNTDN